MTDAWHPQVNGVVRTLDTVARLLRESGHAGTALTPEHQLTVPLPTYQEIRLALFSPRAIGREIEQTKPDCIHIATEGPLGWFARRHCLRNGLAFTTSFHSRFPEMIARRFALPSIEKLAYAVLRAFHAPARTPLVPTPTVARRLRDCGFRHLQVWARGVDTGQFRPSKARSLMVCLAP